MTEPDALTAAEPERERRFIDYLLGMLSPREEEELEGAYIADRNLHAAIQATADDLIHAYLAGALSPDEREKFEDHFLASARGRARVEFIRHLVGAVDRVPVARARGRIIAWLVAAVLVVIAAAWLLRRNPEAPHRQVVAPSATPADPASRPQPRVDGHGGPVVVRLARAARDADLLVPRSATSIRFEVAVEGSSWSYDAVVRTLQGVEVWRADHLELERDGAPVVFSVPAALLAAGQYVLALEPEGLRADDPRAAPVVKCTLRVRRGE